jgi:hypothetical protein
MDIFPDIDHGPARMGNEALRRSGDGEIKNQMRRCTFGI